MGNQAPNLRARVCTDLRVPLDQSGHNSDSPFFGAAEEHKGGGYGYLPTHGLHPWTRRKLFRGRAGHLRPFPISPCSPSLLAPTGLLKQSTTLGTHQSKCCWWGYVCVNNPCLHSPVHVKGALLQGRGVGVFVRVLLYLGKLRQGKPCSFNSICRSAPPTPPLPSPFHLPFICLPSDKKTRGGIMLRNSTFCCRLAKELWMFIQRSLASCRS